MEQKKALLRKLEKQWKDMLDVYVPDYARVEKPLEEEYKKLVKIYHTNNEQLKKLIEEQQTMIDKELNLKLENNELKKSLFELGTLDEQHELYKQLMKEYRSK